MFTHIPMEKSSQKPLTRVPAKPGTPPVAMLTDQQALSPHPTPALSFNLGTIPIFPHDSARTPAPIQRKLAIGEQQGQEEATAQHDGPAAPPSPARHLPEQIKARLEKLSGLSLDDVRVEYNSPQPAILNARAYTQGSRIKLGRGQEQHLVHEAWHAVQQKQGRVKATQQEEGVPINDSEQLEREADQAGASTLAGWSIRHTAVHPLPGSSANQTAPIQRKLWIGSKKKLPVKSEKIEEVMKTVQAIKKADGSVVGMNKTILKGSLFKALNTKAFNTKKQDLLKILEGWVKDTVTEGRTFTTWEKAVKAASGELSSRQRNAGRSEEEKAADKRKIEELTAALPTGEKIKEKDITAEQKKQHRKSLNLLRKEASFATEKIYKDDPEESLGVKRRKLHKEGQDLSRNEFNYGAYIGGTMPGKANAFVLGGSGLEADYKPLFKEIVDQINAGKKEGEKQLTDKDVSQLFLQEFEGKDAFGTFPEHIKQRAHKIIGIIYNAELSRHSIAPLTAAGALYAVASRKEVETEPGLVESFATGSHHLMRPLFAGTGGPNLMRGEESNLTQAQVEEREVRAFVDIYNYYNAMKKVVEENTETTTTTTTTTAEGSQPEEKKTKHEDIGKFTRRRTKEFVRNLSRRRIEEEEKRKKKADGDEDESEVEVKEKQKGKKRKVEKDEEPEERKKRKVEKDEEPEERKKRKVEKDEEPKGKKGGKGSVKTTEEKKKRRKKK